MRLSRAHVREVAPAGPEREDDELLAMWVRDPGFTVDDDDYDPELDDDARRPTADAREHQNDLATHTRFAQGTAQFEVRAPEVADERGETPVSQVMSRKVVCARAEMDASEARRRMLERGVGGMPVVDAWGRPVGMLSKSDLVEHEVTTAPGRASVGDIMMPLCFSLPPDAPIAQAAALMAYEGIHRVVVIDRSGHLVGMISALDVARWMGLAGGYPVGDQS